jgi:hypothetical protein
MKSDEQQPEQGPTGKASSDKSNVQSAARSKKKFRLTPTGQVRLLQEEIDAIRKQDMHDPTIAYLLEVAAGLTKAAKLLIEMRMRTNQEEKSCQ